MKQNRCQRFRPEAALADGTLGSVGGSEPARCGGTSWPAPASCPRFVPVSQLLSDLRALIDQERQSLAQAVNASLVRLYWQIGHRIRTDLKEKRAEYGEQVVHALSKPLAIEFGPGFGRTNLFHMVRFAEIFPDPQIVHALSGQLGWTHFRQLIYLKEPLQREFYAELCRLERWSTRTLAAKIQSMLYERTAISRKPGALARQELQQLRQKDRLTPDLVFRDPYVLDFLGLRDTFSEKDLPARGGGPQVRQVPSHR